MHYTGPVYRHPLEANTPLLEVTYGCSWNKCSFCNMYKSIKFNLSPWEHIQEDLEEMAEIYPKSLDSIVIVNGDPFALSTKRLLKISEMIHEYFPNVNGISSQAAIRNIMTKSLEDLKDLHDVGYDYLYIGLETAYDPALKQMNKGYTQKDEYEQLDKLMKSGISYVSLLMGGVAGVEKSREHVLETAKLLNKYPPKMISIISTGISPGTPLFEMEKNGEFDQLTERELVEEEILLLNELEMPPDCYFFGAHQNNLVKVWDYFKNKEDMIKSLKNGLKDVENTHPDILEAKLKRETL